MGYDINAVAQLPKLGSKTIDMVLDPTNARRVTISQEAYSQVCHFQQRESILLESLAFLSVPGV